MPPLKENGPAAMIPVILLSASPDLLTDFKKFQPADAIEKPFDLTTVIHRIKRYWPRFKRAVASAAPLRQSLTVACENFYTTGFEVSNLVSGKAGSSAGR